jgi:hypothetical protein
MVAPPQDAADLWAALVAAANAGDEKARAFLLTFAPWVVAELETQTRQ